MSIQEEKLQAIADAIREKDGTTEPILANDFPDRIRAIETGGKLPEGVRTITLTADPPEGGTVSGGGVASDGMTVTIHAKSANNYKLKAWTMGGKNISKLNNYEFNVSSDLDLVAEFQEGSPAGELWFKSTLPFYSSWSSVTYGNGKFLMVSSSSSNDKAVYSGDGINWIETVLPVKAMWQCCAYGNGVYVVLARNGIGAYSTDCLNWTQIVLPSTDVWYDTTYGNGVFVAVASGSANAMYSYDGITWVSTQMPTSGSWNSVVYGDGKFVAIISGNATTTTAYSRDGISWGASTIPSLLCGGVAYCDGKFVIVGYDTTKGLYSEDGITWVSTVLPSQASWKSVSGGNGRFVVVAYNSNKALYSDDGVNWLATTLPSYGYWKDIIYGDGKFVAACSSSSAAAFSN